MPNTAPPVRALPIRALADAGRAAESARLILEAGSLRWAVPAASVLRIAEPPAELSPFPHAAAPLIGIADIEGCAVAVLDLVPPGAVAGALVVVAAGSGGLALRVGAVRRDDAPAQSSLPPLLPDLLAEHAPWAPASEGGPAPVFRPATPRRVSLLLVACGGAIAALPAARVGRVGRVSAVQPLRGGGALVRLDGVLLPARHLADALPTEADGTRDGRWAVVLRDGGSESALLVDRVIRLEPCDSRSITSVTLPDGRVQRWLNRPDTDPMPVVDTAETGGPPHGCPAPDSGPSAGTAADPVLALQAGDLRLALPLALADRVVGQGVVLSARPAAGLLPVFDLATALGRRAVPRTGTLVRVRTDGGAPLLLSVDRVQALIPHPPPWRAVAPLPPAAALVIDAAGRDDAGWLFRLRRDLPPPAALPAELRRALAAARLGWADPDAPV